MNDSQVEEHVEGALTKINNNMRLKKSTTNRLVAIKSPSGKICRVSEKKAQGYLDRKGFSLAKEPTKEIDTKDDADKGDDVTAHLIRSFSAKKFEAFLIKYGVDIMFKEDATLPEKKDAVIEKLSLSE